ncbi:23S rRNA (pseudouridine(1915)-N(3))-methyltransferase RlmH [Palleronia caenipelagi]|uniref:Ribosomal RNA large subunit methyltransferase H n=1 Tax=Palleronia caenipelagi TaxID=2489174 RepID=A0A547Q5K9_9RHOB|nr:23S rRNA (pseudouridine(1915)-N(3))-methyltransferase RlmH [Palleronia caenipelagi]TRD21675.1 23S rRNA (pseudouridine(1915)-N(3))-methyltransferase RlmH [Palleronia caenipelagi]
MRVRLCAIGRIRKGPERALIDDYTQRFDRTGRALSLGPLEEIEIEPHKATGQDAEAEALLRAIPDDSVVVALDERGKVMTSPNFAARLGDWRDQGRGEVTFVIGGADGLTDALRDRADLMLSFGQMVWPHMLARVMLTEQLYRAASILAGSPYHRV